MQVPPTETELLKQQEDGRTLSAAAEKLAEQQDEVKAMNQMVLYSKCVTIRDAQLQERKHMMLEEEAQSRQLDTMMEAERIKALENYEARERQRQTERLQGAQARTSCLPVVRACVRTREQHATCVALAPGAAGAAGGAAAAAAARGGAAGARARGHGAGSGAPAGRGDARQGGEAASRAAAHCRGERHATLAHLCLKKACFASFEDPHCLVQVVAANSEQVGRKKAMQSREAEEEARIAEYNRAKAAREAALQAERERVAAEKEREIARLRAAQEKAADKQSELHELRARRHAEAAEREWRAQEMAKAARDKVRALSCGELLARDASANVWHAWRLCAGDLGGPT